VGGPLVTFFIPPSAAGGLFMPESPLRALLCLAPLALVAQAPAPAAKPEAPLDLKAVQAEMGAAMKSVTQAFQKHTEAGGKRQDFHPDYAAATAGLRAKAEAASGVQQEAYRVGELVMCLRLGAKEDATKALLAKIPASSQGWTVAADMLGRLPERMPTVGPAYVKAVAAQGFPEVRAELKAAALSDLLEESKVEEARALVASLVKEFPGAPATKKAQETFDRESKLAVGMDAPDFSIPDMEKPGETLTKASFKGKYLLIDFWGTWCSWCVKDLPHTHNVFNKHKAKLQILSLGNDPDAATINAFRKEKNFPMPWKHALIPRGSAILDTMMKTFAVQGFPTLYLLDPSGKIVAKGMDLRLEKFEPTMDRILGK
jgi:thiol-disulfide isomerase/thioredoxin